MKYALTIAALLLLITACGQTQAGPNIGTPFIGGNDGIEPALVQGMPPAQVLDGGRMPFTMGVALKNVGEADVGTNTRNPYVMVSLEGFRPSAFGVSGGDLVKGLGERPLLGARKNFDGTILPGQLLNVIFPQLMYVENLEGNIIQNMVTKLCYDYETFVTVPLCFKDEVFESVEDICTQTGEKIPQNSGAPIHVTSVVQNPLGGAYETMVSFNVEHVGTGDFYGRSTDEICNPRVDNLNKYKVLVTVSSDDPDMDVTCGLFGESNTGWLTMYAGSPQLVTCVLTPKPNTEGNRARIYTDPLKINLQYRYGEMINQPMVIQAVGGRGDALGTVTGRNADSGATTIPSVGSGS